MSEAAATRDQLVDDVDGEEIILLQGGLSPDTHEAAQAAQAAQAAATRVQPLDGDRAHGTAGTNAWDAGNFPAKCVLELLLSEHAVAALSANIVPLNLYLENVVSRTDQIVSEADHVLAPFGSRLNMTYVMSLTDIVARHVTNVNWCQNVELLCAMQTGTADDKGHVPAHKAVYLEHLAPARYPDLAREAALLKADVRHAVDARAADALLRPATHSTAASTDGEGSGDAASRNTATKAAASAAPAATRATQATGAGGSGKQATGRAAAAAIELLLGDVAALGPSALADALASGRNSVDAAVAAAVGQAGANMLDGGDGLAAVFKSLEHLINQTIQTSQKPPGDSTHEGGAVSGGKSKAKKKKKKKKKKGAEHNVATLSTEVQKQRDSLMELRAQYKTLTGLDFQGPGTDKAMASILRQHAQDHPAPNAASAPQPKPALNLPPNPPPKSKPAFRHRPVSESSGTGLVENATPENFRLSIHKKMSNSEATALLARHGGMQPDGKWLLRLHKDDDDLMHDEYVLSVVYRGKGTHHLIQVRALGRGRGRCACLSPHARRDTRRRTIARRHAVRARVPD